MAALVAVQLLGWLGTGWAQNTPESGTWWFEGYLTDVNGVYSGVLWAIDETVAGVGDGVAGFDVYARNGATATYDVSSPGTPPIGYATGTVSGHDAYTTAGGWGSFYNPDVADWYNYQLTLTGSTWAVQYNANVGNDHILTGASAAPMSGSMNWSTGLAEETGTGAYYPSMGVAESPGYAAAFAASIGETTAGAWDMDWSWGSEYIPLQYSTYRVEVTYLSTDSNGDLYRVSMRPVGVPVASAHNVKNVTATSATLSGAVVDDGALPCEIRFHYASYSDALMDGTAVTDGEIEAEFGPLMTTDWMPIGLVRFVDLTGLTPNTHYGYTVEVRNGVGSAMGSQYVQTFTTLSRIVLSSTEGGSVAVPGEGTLEMEAGTVIDVQAVAAEGYGFAGWEGSAVDAGLVADPTAEATTVEVTGDLTLVATFLPLYTVTISSGEGGSVTAPGEGEFIYLAGTVVNVTALPDISQIFAGWSGSAVDAGLVADPSARYLTLEVTQDMTLEANFADKPRPYIIWVDDNLKYDFDTNEPSSIGFVQLLREQGYYVDFKGETMPHEPGNDEHALNPDWLYWRELDDRKIAELEDADLIIIGRVANSGSYDDANEAELWNSISTPMISQNAHISRQPSKWGWFATGSTTNKTPRLMQVMAPDHAIFKGVTIDADGNVDLVDPNAQVTLVKLNEGNVAGNGRLLGVHDEGYPWIVEWDAGVEYYEGSGQFAGGPRMFLGSAAGKTMGGLVEGGYNLTEDGRKVFLNAVQYMLNKNTEIVWVSFHAADDSPHADAVSEGFTVAPDVGYTDLLRGQGYTVTRYVTTSDPNAAVLNAADLVIIGRSVNSGNYSNDAATAWNGIAAPMIVMSGYTLRTSRMGYTTGTTMADTTGPAWLLVEEPAHPIFAGVSMTDGVMDNPYTMGLVPYPTDPCLVSRGVSINTDPPSDQANVLATLLAGGDDPTLFGAMVIAEYGAGSTMVHSGGAGTDILAGRRLVFLSGSREASGIQSETAGLFDLSPDGVQLFLNAVTYMLSDNLLLNGSFEQPGTDKQKNWDNVPYWNSDTTAVDSGVETGWGATDGIWTGFMKGADPAVYQLSRHVLGAGETLTFSIDAKSNWAATDIQLTIYVDDAGVRTPIATAAYAITGDMTTYSVSVDADAVPDAIGKRVGVELDNVSAEGNSWIGMDRAVLTVQ